MRKLKRIWEEARRQEGYLTIEITMVFSVLFFSLIFILFLGMVMYQQVNLQSLAVRASERGSVIYSSRVKDMASGVKTLDDFLIRDPYRNVPFMDGANQAEYAAIIDTYIGKNLGKGDILQDSGKQAGGYVTVEDYLIEKRIRVSIGGSYGLPVDSIARMFGQNGPFEVNVTAVSSVTDPPDFIRNVDLAMDVAKRTKLFGTVQEGYEKIRGALESVTDLLQ